MTRETKTFRHYFVDEAHFTNKTDRPPHAKDSLLNQKHATSKRPLSHESTINHHAAAATSMRRYSEKMQCDSHFTNDYDSHAIIIEIPTKGHYPTLGLEVSTNNTSRIITENMKKELQLAEFRVGGLQ